MRKYYPLISSFLILSVILNIFQYISRNHTSKNTFKVKSVIDGDTIVLENNQSVRLSNVYAPDLQFCGGLEAKEYLEDLLLGKSVSIETNAEDFYNRTLALVYLDDTLVNENLLKEGLVRYDGSPNSKRDRLKEAYDYAVENKLGIHGPPCRSDKPNKSGCIIKGNIRRSDGAKNYFFPGCSEYNATIVEKDLGESWFCSEKEAKEEGYIKGTHCPTKFK